MSKDASAMTSLRQLLNHLNDAVATLEKVCAEEGTKIPDLNEPFHPSSETFRMNPKAAQATSIISAAALHIDAIVSPPPVSLYHIVGGFWKSTALRICLEANVTEIIREAGPEGIHVNDIATKSGQDARKLSRFLRYLATHHVYRELKPDVFTNNRISSLLDTLKPSKDLFADPLHKHDNTSGLPALAAHHLDEVFKASAYGWETCADPNTVKSGDPTASPFVRAVSNGETYWDYNERPEEEWRRHRFNIGMHGVQSLQPPDAVLKAYDWKDLPAGSLIVDVGGGLGASDLPLAQKFPDLKIIVQDLPKVVDQGLQFWNEKMPEALKQGQVKLEGHDFFNPQPNRKVSIFLTKQILHDWSDEYCLKFLIQLRKAAGHETKLICMETILPYACHDPSVGNLNRIPGSVPREAPAPLLANWGAINSMGYHADFAMFSIFNSQERTMQHFVELLRGAGWKVTSVHRQEGDSAFLQSIVSVPIEI